MRKNMKFHAIAIGSICLIITVLFLVMGPKEAAAPVDPNTPSGDRYIRIYSATYGQNCNPDITRLRSEPVKLNDDGTMPELPQLVQRDNALLALSSLCDGRLSCTTTLSDEALKVDPVPRCYKQLKLSYRCYTIDRLWAKEFNQGDTLTIDCHEGAEGGEQAQPAAQ
jgi:hypothetical protein